MKQRLDIFLTQNNFFQTRSKAVDAINQCAIYVDGKMIIKPSFLVDETNNIEVIKDTCPYVSRAGLKLEKAINYFNIDFKNQVVLDIGASTGGFTDCSLKYGAKKVISVDVGSGQLNEKLLLDNRIVNLEKTNIINLDKKYFDEANIIVCDVSFVSGVYIFNNICDKIKQGTTIIWLIKPQFECGKDIAKKYKGIISDINLSLKIAKDALNSLNRTVFKIEGIVQSPIKGGDGNTEYLAYIKK